MFNRSNNLVPCPVLVGVGSTKSCPVFLACDPNITTTIAMYHAMMLKLAAGLSHVLPGIYSSGSQPSLALVYLALPLSGYYSRRPDSSSGPIPHYRHSLHLGSTLVLTLYWELKWDGPEVLRATELNSLPMWWHEWGKMPSDHHPFAPTVKKELVLAPEGFKN